MKFERGSVDSLIEQLKALPGVDAPPPPDPPLPPGDGHGNGGAMEPRIAKLEAHMEHVRAELAKLAAVPVDIATLKTKVEHLPGKGFVVTSAITTVAAVTGLLVLLQRLGILH